MNERVLPPLFSSALLIEDEANLAVALKIALRKLGIPVRHASTLKAAELSVSTEKPDFILLDRSLPDGEGLDLCLNLREQGFDGTILVLTAAGETLERVRGLNAGADDYLPKPFSWEELEARVRALARRKPPSANKITPASTATAAPEKTWQIDADRLRIHGPLGWNELTPLEFRLATHLMDAQGAILSREDLLKSVWGFTLLPKTRTVDHFLGRLRKMFEANPEEPKHFLTVRGAGYRFER
jgi:DNA-binding response OmpR family regulator